MLGSPICALLEGPRAVVFATSRDDLRENLVSFMVAAAFVED